MVYGPKRELVAVGLWDPASPIRVKVLAHGRSISIDEAFFDAAVKRAAAVRAVLEGEGTDGYRIIHGENDGLPGLIVDRYGDTRVVKIYSTAWAPHLPHVLRALARHQPASRSVLRLSRRITGQARRVHGLRDGMLLEGEDATRRAEFRENGLRFIADPFRGQKTGFFLDQRDNRMRVEKLAEGKRVLNVFSYSGGFSLYAARGGAREVTAVDSSHPAHEDAERNFALNRQEPAVQRCRHRTRTGDAFRILDELRDRGQRYDLVIVDPPSFAKKVSQLPAARRAYAKLAAGALDVLEHGGTLVFASCSSRLDEETLVDIIQTAARRAGRPLREPSCTGHALDHPVGFPEGRYLKCFFANA